MKGLGDTVRNWLGWGPARRGGLQWRRIQDAEKTEFFRWFSFAKTGVTQGAEGNAVVSFRPAGEKFHRLVKLDAVLDAQHRIASLHLSLARAFVDHQPDALFARDITKSFLRSAFPKPDDRAVASLADEIEWRHDFPVIAHASHQPPPLPAQPSAGFLTYVGRQQFFKTDFSRSDLRIEQTSSEEGEAVMISVRAR